MKIFGRTGGYFLFWSSAVYFLVGMFNIFVYNFTKVEYIQAVWIFWLWIPLVVKPVARYFNMRTLWENL